MLGIKLTTFSSWWSNQKDNKQVGGEITTAQVCAQFIMPFTKESNCSLLEYFQNEDKESVGPATVFVSHAWSNKFENLLDALLSNCDPLSTFIWLDIVAINQHRAAQHEYDQDFWTRSFHESIRSINNTLLVLEPWEAPLPVQRCWCLWEIFGSIHQADDNAAKPQFRVILSRAEQQLFLNNVMDAFETIIQNLSSIDARKADAFDPSDKASIFKAIEDTIGFEFLNEAVIGELRNWLLKTSADHLVLLSRTHSLQDVNEVSTSDLVKGLIQVGQVYQHFNLEHKAKPLFERSLKWLDGLKEVHGSLTEAQKNAFATAHTNLGMILLNTGRKQDETGVDVEDHFVIAKDTHLELSGNEENAVHARCLNNIGIACMAKNANEKAITAFKNSIGVKKKLLQRSSSGNKAMLGELGVSLNNLAALYHRTKDYQECVKSAREALEYLTQALGDDHPNVATVLANIAVGLLDSETKGSSPELELVTKIDVPQQPTLTSTDESNHSKAKEDGRFALKELEHSVSRKEALELMARSLKIDRKVYGTEHRKIPIRLYYLARAQWELGNFQDAMTSIEESLGITDRLGVSSWEIVDAQVALSLAKLIAANPSASLQDDIKGGDRLSKRIEPVNDHGVQNYAKLVEKLRQTDHDELDERYMYSNLYVPMGSRKLQKKPGMKLDWDPVTQQGLAIIPRPAEVAVTYNSDESFFSREFTSKPKKKGITSSKCSVS